MFAWHDVQGWLGSKDAILHSGEGPIQTIKWAGTLIAWANDLGVKVHDTSVHQRIAYIERPKSRCWRSMLTCQHAPLGSLEGPAAMSLHACWLQNTRHPVGLL